MISTMTLMFVIWTTAWLIGCQWLVIARRRGQKIAYGDGDDLEMRNRIRVHANALETLLPFSILLVVVDIAMGSTIWMLGIAVTMIIGRILHPIGIMAPHTHMWARVSGMFLTLVSTGALVLYAIVLSLAS